MDLLTVLVHEMGHVLGYEHDDGGVMAQTLSAGKRLGLHGIDAEQPAWLAAATEFTCLMSMRDRHG